MYYKNWWWSSIVGAISTNIYVVLEHTKLGAVHRGTIQTNKDNSRNFMVEINGNIHLFSGESTIECVEKFIDWLE